MEKFIASLIVFIIGLVFGVYEAWLFMDLWEWFVVPLGVPALNLWQTFGLLMVIGWRFMGVHASVLNVNKKEEDVAEFFGDGIGMAFGMAVIYTIMWAIGLFVSANLL